MSGHEANRALLAPLRAAMYDWTTDGARSALTELFTPDAVVQLAFPFETLDGPAALFGEAYQPLAAAFPDLERRDYICIAGVDPGGNDWVGCAGHYTGTWVEAFLGIPATGRPAVMRFHEFFRFVDGRVVESQALWDIPELMMQAGVWPMAPSLGTVAPAPAPASNDGMPADVRDAAASQASVATVVGMLVDMGKHPAEPMEVMRLEHWWHPYFGWYGPAAIGTSRGVDGFRRHHQIPFLDAFPDRRGGYKNDGHFFGDGDYVGVTAWPGMFATHTGSGLMGLPATGREITMRSLDFWRVENDRIRENWVLVDIPHLLDQLGVDVFARMNEMIHRYGGSR